MKIPSLFFWRKKRQTYPEISDNFIADKIVENVQIQPHETQPDEMDIRHVPIRRHFYNEQRFQCYATFFKVWKGWVTAGHSLTDAAHIWPNFTGNGEGLIWPGGLDAALKGCQLPKLKPAKPYSGQNVIIRGFPAGSRHMEERRGSVYLERGTGSGVWIAHIKTPDEPVVTGMSGGPVMDETSGAPIGILITRNSPADLNSDRDPDESCDLVSLRAVWDADNQAQNMA